MEVERDFRSQRKVSGTTARAMNPRRSDCDPRRLGGYRRRSGGGWSGICTRRGQCQSFKMRTRPCHVLIAHSGEPRPQSSGTPPAPDK